MTKVEILVMITVLIILPLLAFGMPFKMSPTKAGQHTGFITAIEQQGYIFPNYRVYVKTDNSSSQEDEYCLHRSRNDLANRVKQLSKSRQRVTVMFRGVWGIGWGLCDDIEITDIEETQ